MGGDKSNKIDIGTALGKKGGGGGGEIRAIK